MKRIMQGLVWGMIIVLWSAVTVSVAEEAAPAEVRYVKLDNQGRRLPREAPAWTMVLDTATGLMWEVKTTDGSIHDMQAGFDWEGAHAIFLAELNGGQFGGFSDWRLPTTEELRTIWVKGVEPAVDAEFFPHTVPSSYLSWRECGSGEIFDERVKFGPIRNNKASRQVRAVRGGDMAGGAE